MTYSYPIVAALPPLTIDDARTAQHASALIVGCNNERIGAALFARSGDVTDAVKHLDIARDMASDANVVCNTITDDVIKHALIWAVQACYQGFIDAQSAINAAIKSEDTE